MSKYQNSRNTRREARTIAGRFRGGKLVPVMGQVFRESESGMLSQSVGFELDAIAGRMLTPITAEVISVYVPAQAMDALKNPLEDYSGNTEIVRDKLLSGSPLFDLEEESEISQRMGVVPRSVAGVKKVNEVCRLAHNAAVNYLRQRKYVKATQLLANNTAITPALISQTVLDRLNGVLDPEDRVEGAVKFEMGNITMPLTGTAPVSGVLGDESSTSRTVTKPLVKEGGAKEPAGTTPVEYRGLHVRANGGGFTPPTADLSGVVVDFTGYNTGEISLSDFYNAEIMDRLTREMRAMVDANPEYGEEMVTRWAHGLSVETGKTPFIVHRSSKVFGQNYRRAMDGPSLDEAQTDMAVQIDFTVPIPPTELGGVVVTFASLKPDETLASQPHPILSDAWGAINYVSDEMARDPVPVTIRELDADCDTSDEETRAFYVGHNELKRAYVNYGFSRNTDLTKVENKTAIWQLEVPMSVTPDSVIYPEELDHYPFADQLAEVCTYTASSMATVRTPLIFGPTPVEELAEIEDADIFEDAP